MTKWLPFELHTHTPHSDGKHTLLEMAQNARKLGLVGIALTDHNTMSGLEEKEFVTGQTGIHIMQGLEWTTFYGHMVTLGIREYVDWRNLSPIDIHKGIKEVHKQNGVAGIAHPYRIGSPICTGCFWEYDIADWQEIDYIEVWSGTFPSIVKSNARAYQLWLDKLNEGFTISATSGRDWHNSNMNDGPISATYLEVEENEPLNDQTLVEAIREGKMIVSMGPIPMMTVKNREGNIYSVGAKIEKASLFNKESIEVGVDYSARNGHWNLEEQELKLVVKSNVGILHDVKASKENAIQEIKVDLREINWIITELHGTFNGVKTMIGFTNPIYLI
ncbi:CehA/McbA family metallohydrolase [Bacillus sp. UNC41MFS5]|uniref:CehA/McbA family metallohydrolase n=1 Tax=Bacillus sp. UNC41MFS5 TaxID=1449046 RepID=UPI00047C720D|nr:CehA/McbA family metallohydrolase [Bacillus sp. UNC41MFS5]